MDYTLNNTESYHIHEMDTLGWELTVCNSLEPAESPCRRILKNNSTYGNLLYNYCKSLIPLESIDSIIEIGGGYGYIMRDFLRHKPFHKAAMLDISPYLLSKQKDTLKDFTVDFIEKDFFEASEKYLQTFQLAILNENIGDFPTACDVDPKIIFEANGTNDPIINRIKYFFTKYELEFNKKSNFNFNLGACEATEKLVLSEIPYIFMSEHSCEAVIPENFLDKISITSAGAPERISLKGHDEYTIKFSHLKKLLDYHGYSVIRGNFIQFIEILDTDELQFILTSHSQKDEHEIIRHFVEDLIKYEYLLAVKKQTLK